MTISAPAGGAVLNATNDADQDLFVTVSQPGAPDKKTFFGPSVATNLTLGVGLTEMMRITNNGNVGIGAPNPNARLTIAAPAGGAVLNASNYTDQDMFISLSSPGATDKKTYFGPSTNTNLTLGVGLVERMRITNAGRVGIGTAAPGATLEVNGSALIDGQVGAFAGAFAGPNGGLLGEDTMNDSTVRYGVQGLATGYYGVGVRGGGNQGINVTVSSGDAAGGVGVFGAGLIGVYGYAGSGVS